MKGPKVRRCLVVGAGVAGLLAATRLLENGVAVTVIDEQAGPGGRMATRHHLGGVWDHGAQYFTARDPCFRGVAKAWQAAGVATTWFRGLPPPDPPDLPLDDPRRDEPHHCGVGGMRAIAEHIAAPLHVHWQTRALRLTAADRWTLQALTGGHDTINFESDAVVLTAPVPRSLALLDPDAPSLATIRAQLGDVCYEPTLALLALLEGPSELAESGAHHGDGDPVDWIADNRKKGISPTPTITVHAAGAFSRRHFEDEPDEWAPTLLEAVRPLLGAPVAAWWTHRWRYATPVETYPERTLVSGAPSPIAFAGDAFAGPRVEGAALSGIAAADALLTHLRPSEDS